MKGLILTHIDNMGLDLFGYDFKRDLFGRVESDLEKGVKVYNFKHWDDPVMDLMNNSRITTVDYLYGKDEYNLELYGDIDYQFFIGKKQMIDDGITELDICGWNIGVCIKNMMELMNGEKTGFYIKKLGVSEDQYQGIMKTQIPIKLIPELSRH